MAEALALISICLVTPVLTAVALVHTRRRSQTRAEPRRPTVSSERQLRDEISYLRMEMSERLDSLEKKLEDRDFATSQELAELRKRLRELEAFPAENLVSGEAGRIAFAERLLRDREAARPRRRQPERAAS